MPTVVISMKSQGNRHIADRPNVVAVGKRGGQEHQDRIRWNEESGEVVCDLSQDDYRIDLSVSGHKGATLKLPYLTQPKALTVDVASRCVALPLLSQLNNEQRRLLQSLDEKKAENEIWRSLSANKAATFFQVTYALSATTNAVGDVLSTLVDRVTVLGGAELKARDTSQQWRRVVGWRMHVAFKSDMDPLLAGFGFKRDKDPAHDTHAAYGFTKSHRQKGSQPRLQITTDKFGTAADVDLDVSTPIHRSAPHDVYKEFAKRFPGTKAIYRVV